MIETWKRQRAHERGDMRRNRDIKKKRRRKEIISDIAEHYVQEAKRAPKDLTQWRAAQPWKKNDRGKITMEGCQTDMIHSCHARKSEMDLRAAKTTQSSSSGSRDILNCKSSKIESLRGLLDDA